MPEVVQDEQKEESLAGPGAILSSLPDMHARPAQQMILARFVADYLEEQHEFSGEDDFFLRKAFQTVEDDLETDERARFDDLSARPLSKGEKPQKASALLVARFARKEIESTGQYNPVDLEKYERTLSHYAGEVFIALSTICMNYGIHMAYTEESGIALFLPVFQGEEIEKISRIDRGKVTAETGNTNLSEIETLSLRAHLAPGITAVPVQNGERAIYISSVARGASAMGRILSHLSRMGEIAEVMIASYSEEVLKRLGLPAYHVSSPVFDRACSFGVCMGACPHDFVSPLVPFEAMRGEITRRDVVTALGVGTSENVAEGKPHAYWYQVVQPGENPKTQSRVLFELLEELRKLQQVSSSETPHRLRRMYLVGGTEIEKLQRERVQLMEEMSKLERERGLLQRRITEIDALLAVN